MSIETWCISQSWNRRSLERISQLWTALGWYWIEILINCTAGRRRWRRSSKDRVDRQCLLTSRKYYRGTFHEWRSCHADRSACAWSGLCSMVFLSVYLTLVGSVLRILIRACGPSSQSDSAPFTWCWFGLRSRGIGSRLNFRSRAHRWKGTSVLTWVDAHSDSTASNARSHSLWSCQRWASTQLLITVPSSDYKTNR